MPTKPRVVVDTNVFVSQILKAQSIAARAAQKAVVSCVLLGSEETIGELAAILARPKFDRYASQMERAFLLDVIRSRTVLIPIRVRITACRDPSDDKFLEVAVNGAAELLLTGDNDLLVLHPFRGISILSPATFLVDALQTPSSWENSPEA